MDTPDSNQNPKHARTHEAPSLNSVTTIRDDGSRRFLYPADARGRFFKWRTIAAAALILIYGLMPWIPINGFPAVFLDVAQRRFHLFGMTFAAQDMWMLFFLITGLGFTLFFVTALLGRIWCGWACPHTVFLDFVYRRIERWIDGDSVARRRLAEAPLSGSKIARRTAKHGLYIIASAAIAHLFLAYFVSIPELWRMINSAPEENWSLFAFMMIATGVLYFNFAWFREQLCIVICPYGRLQSALIDDNSLVIGYDKKRGEPRGKLGTTGAGDCISCNRCVQVCPTGIDIRQGLQLECVGCAACIDACDEVMDRVERPRGLIRYDSLDGLSGGRTRWIRPRTIVYATALLIGAIVSGITFSRVRPADFAVTRIVGTPYIIDSHDIRNQFMVRLVNKTNKPANFIVNFQGGSHLVQTGLDGPVTIGPMAEELLPVVYTESRSEYTEPFSFTIVMSDEKKTFEIRRSVDFLGPDAALLK